MGISGVPFFMAYKEGDEDSEPVCLSGAQPAKAFIKVIEKLS
jgi:predicted DsbA family dithiol-disulfide isomerase